MTSPWPVRFHAPVEEWLRRAFPGPTRAQALGWPEIQAGRSTLVFAPTGSGKTLAAFLAALDRLMFEPLPGAAERCRVLYVSPLRALAVDVERNLRVPLSGIARVAEERGEPYQALEVGLRTGDTPPAERARLLRRPPDILITTPESLFLLLTSRARERLASVELVIVDEIHVLVGSKRGAHLAVSLERLEHLARRPLQRVGLSATQRPLSEVARYLGGVEPGGDGRPRPVQIVDAGARKAFELAVEMPVQEQARPAEPGTPLPPSIWPAIHPRLVDLVRAHRSTLLFVNSRRLAERLAADLNDTAGEELARAHHGSLAREQRLAIEEALKAGRLPALVATSSLELGIDMGAVDLVVQIETPPSVASAMQRIGRAGHQAEGVSRGVIFPKYRGDLLGTAAVTRAMQEAAVEETRIPQNPLDVLAQQLVAMAVSGEWTVDALEGVVRGAAPFAQLPRAQLEGVLDMLSGRYPSDEFAELRPRLVWDRRRNLVRAREGAGRLVVQNAGTIPDRGLYGVFLAADAGEPGTRPASRRVGELDEEMVFESRPGEVFVLGASSWRIVEITRDQVLVAPAPGEPGRTPFWKGDRPPRPIELGRAIGRLTRELLDAPRPEAHLRLVRDHALAPPAAETLLGYLDEQRRATGAVPDDRTLVLERTRDEMGDWRLCLLSPFGGRVHAPWALALEARLRATGEAEVETVWSDDGIVVRLSDREDPPDAAALLPAAAEIEPLLLRELGATALFSGRFREAAGRALLLPRRRPGQRQPLWMQRKRAADLLAVASRYPSFPLILETFRECLQEVFDVPALVELARQVERRELRLVTVDTPTPSPFAASLLFGYVANYIYDGDAPLAERRAQALAVDSAQLRELLGQAELRELLDAEALEEVEAALQARSPDRRVRTADALHDLLLRLGDLSAAEVADRVEGGAASADALLVALAYERRAATVTVAGETRFLAAEDAGRWRDAFGAAPSDVPEAFLAPVPDALEQVVSRYARTHGPFLAAEVAQRYGVPAAGVEQALQRLAARGRVREGEFRPGGHGHEWCEADVLDRLRRLSLARLRRQVEPAPPEALARLLLAWHGVAPGPSPSRRGGADALLDVIEQLQGAALPASALEVDVLPVRLPGYRPSDLDLLCAAGEVVWAGLEPLGEHDGRVSLYLADAAPRLHAPSLAEAPRGEIHDRIRAHLARVGASFFAEVHAAAGGGLVQPVVDALWDLVWAGEVTSDAPSALRAFVQPPSRGRGLRRRASSFRSRRAVPPAAVGRWSLVAPAASSVSVSSTERVKALSDQLLARHGVLTRAAVLAEGVPGGFSAVLPVLRALEEAGRIRRGYFLAGLGGSQFASPGALERLRSLREAALEGPPTAVVLAAADPANTYGAALPWPKAAAGRALRAAGAHVVLVDGALAAFVGRGQREVTLFLPEDEPFRTRTAEAMAAALARWCEGGAHRALGWSRVDGTPVVASVLAPFLLAAGFVPSGPGLRLATAPAAAEGGPDEPATGEAD